MKIGQHNRPHQYSEGGETHDHLNWYRKSMWQNSTHFHEIGGIQGKYLNIIKAICEKNTENTYSIGKDWKLFL